MKTYFSFSYSFDCEDGTTGLLLFDLLKTLKIDRPVFLKLFRATNPYTFVNMLRETSKKVEEFRKREDTFLFFIDPLVFCEETRSAFGDTGKFPTEVTVAVPYRDIDKNCLSTFDFDVEKDKTRFDFSVYSWSEGMILNFNAVYFEKNYIKELIEEWENTFLFTFKKRGDFGKKKE